MLLRGEYEGEVCNMYQIILSIKFPRDINLQHGNTSLISRNKSFHTSAWHEMDEKERRKKLKFHFLIYSSPRVIPAASIARGGV